MAEVGSSQIKQQNWCTLLDFGGNTMPALIVKSFISDCYLYPKIILHKDFKFFREYLASIGMKFSCEDSIYNEDHDDNTFCVELSKKELKVVRVRESVTPSDGAWSSIRTLQIRRRLGLGIWKWNMPMGTDAILNCFVMYCQKHEDFKLNPKLYFFNNFLAKFSLDRGADTEEIYVFEKADELRRVQCGYIEYNSDEERELNNCRWVNPDNSDNESSGGFNDRSVNPKKQNGHSKTTSKKPKTAKCIKQKSSVGTHRNKKKGPSSKSTISCSQCKNTYKLRAALRRHLVRAHNILSNSSLSQLCNNTDSEESNSSASEDEVESSDQELPLKRDSPRFNATVNQSTEPTLGDKKRYSPLRTEGRASIRCELKEIVNDLNIRIGRKHHIKDIKSVTDNKRTKIKCSHCDLTYATKKSLRRHYRNSHPWTV